MTTTINQACIGNSYLVMGIFLLWEMRIFLLLGRILPPPPHLQDFPQIVGLGKVVGPSIHGEGNKQDKKRGNIFGKMGNTGSNNSGR